MKKIFTLLNIIALSAGISFAQQRSGLEQNQPDTLRQKMVVFYKKSLGVDLPKAEQVVGIMDSYKRGMKALQEERNLSEEAKREKIKALMAEKNKKLAALLSPEQQARIIPGTERDPSVGSRKN